MKYIIFYSWILLLMPCMLVAQQTHTMDDPLELVHRATYFFQDKQYAQAYPLLKQLVHQAKSADRIDQSTEQVRLNYMYLVCRLFMEDRSAEDEAASFILTEDKQAEVQMLRYHLGNYYFNKGIYFKAIDLFDAAGIEHLTNEEVAELKFHKAYAYFKLQQKDKALTLFDAIRQVGTGAHVADAHYYYGLLLFEQNQYDPALVSFRKIEDVLSYAKIVPYYIATILYQKGEVQKALDYALAKIPLKDVYQRELLQRIAAQALFSQKKYAQSLTFLLDYAASGAVLTREDRFKMGYCHLQLQQVPEAIQQFKQISGTEDTLSQHALFLLGDAYLKNQQKSLARNAFLLSSTSSFDIREKEIARFQYAKLSYELEFQDLALTELQDFIIKYPQSIYLNEARELLIAMMAQTNNFREALELFESLKNPSPAVLKLYPRVLYGRAVEWINDDVYRDADQLLQRAQAMKDNQAVLPYVYFWRGEIALRNGNIEDARNYLNQYLQFGNSYISGEANPPHAHYNLGYCYFRKEDYKNAINQFESALVVKQKPGNKLEQDALLRMADCWYMLREFSKARSIYETAISGGWSAADYALFQSAMIAGVSNQREKIQLLQSFPKKHPSSNWQDDVDMELAGVFLAQEQYKDALPALNRIISGNRNSLKAKAYLRQGIAYYNLDQNDQALKSYQTLLQQFPDATEAQDAFENARMIYLEQGKVDDFIGFAKSMGKEIDASQEEQLTYEEAERLFSNGNFNGAIQKFEKYLNKYPEGKFSLEALNYKSDIFLSQKNWQAAAEGFEKLADRAPHKFGEKALLQAARLNFFDLKFYERSSLYYAKLITLATTQENRLEGMRGLLRSQFQLQQWQAATDNAQLLLQQKGIGTDDQLLANLAIAKSYQIQQQWAEAIIAYKKVASISKAAYGAEARFEIARSYFEQRRWDEAEKAAFEVINKSGSYELWVTRAYILLGDVYFNQKDFFNAKATYQSVMDHTSVEALRLEAEQKIKAVNESEQKRP